MSILRGSKLGFDSGLRSENGFAPDERHIAGCRRRRRRRRRPEDFVWRRGASTTTDKGGVGRMRLMMMIAILEMIAASAAAEVKPVVVSRGGRRRRSTIIVFLILEGQAIGKMFLHEVRRWSRAVRRRRGDEPRKLHRSPGEKVVSFDTDEHRFVFEFSLDSPVRV